MSLWTPAQLPPGTLGIWFDATDPATITLNGGNVAQINDKSGNGRHAVQATAANQPVYSAAAINGRPALDSGAATRWMLASFGSLTLTSGFMFAVFRRNSGVATPSLIGLGRSTNINPRFRAQRTGFETEHRPDSGGGTTLATGPAADTAAHVGAYGFRPAELVLTIDGARTATSGTFGQITVDQFTLLTSPIAPGTGNADAALGEVLFLPSDVVAADRQRIEGYLAWKWGLQANLPADHPWRLGAPDRRDASAAATVPVSAASTASVITTGSVAAQAPVTGASEVVTIIEAIIDAAASAVARAFGNVLAFVRPRYRFVVPAAGMPLAGGSAGYTFTAEPKDPAAVLEYEMDWSAWLVAGETLVQPAEVSVTGDVEVSFARVEDGRFVRWRLSGGSAGTDSLVTISIDTSSGQTDERTIRVPLRDL